MIFITCLGVIGLVLIAWFVASFTIVKPGYRKLVWKRFGRNAGVLRVLDAGTHFLNAFYWGSYGQGPFRSLIPKINKPWNHEVPIPGSRIFIDPDRTEIMSSDGVPGTANIALELRILDWDVTDVVGATTAFKDRACITANQWVANQLSKLDAAKLCSYASVTSTLNDPQNLSSLNESLRDCFLICIRISVDSCGIKLHDEYAKTIGREIQSRRGISLQRIDAEAAEESMTRRLKLQVLEGQSLLQTTTLRSEAELVAEKVKADSLATKITSLIRAGLSANQAANIVCAEISAAGVAKAEKVYIGMPQGVIGMKGLEQVVLDAFEKV